MTRPAILPGEAKDPEDETAADAKPKRFGVTIAPEIHAQLKEIAKANDRDLMRQLDRLLRKAFEAGITGE